MPQIFIIILFRISPKKLLLCSYYSQNVLIILKIIPNFHLNCSTFEIYNF